jgi:hypothetical protein
MKSKFVNGVVCLALLAMFAVPAVTAPVASAASTPPVLSVGNSWNYNVAYNSGSGETDSGTLAVVVSSTAGDNYALTGTFGPQYASRQNLSPALSVRVYSAAITIKKANMQYVQQVATTKVNILGMWLSDDATVTWTYYTDATYTTPTTVPFPLNPGDHYYFQKHTTDALGQVNRTDNRAGTVLGWGYITVPGGTYWAMHVAEYNPASPGTYTYEHWFSETVGSDVKMIDRETLRVWRPESSHPQTMFPQTTP